MIEIGSDFYDYSLNGKERTKKLWWEKNENNNVSFFKSGRNAIKALLQMLKGYEKKALLPAYTCETVIQPFIDEGWEIKFYLMNKDLSVNKNSLLSAYKAFNPSMLFCHGYFGFDTLQSVKDVIKEIHNNGTIVVEDITQSIFSNHCIEFADYYVSSLRKFMAIPDGGVVFSENKLNFSNVIEADKTISKLALNAFDLKKEYFNAPTADKKQAFRKEYQELKKCISDNLLITNISPESKKIFKTCNLNWIENKRISNYLFLAKNIKNFKFIEAVFETEIDGNIPLYFPVYVKNGRKKLQDYLAAHNIYCPVVWPKPPQVCICDEETDYIYESMLCFPIDQRYCMEDMERMVSTLESYEG